MPDAGREPFLRDAGMLWRSRRRAPAPRTLQRGEPRPGSHPQPAGRPSARRDERSEPSPGVGTPNATPRCPASLCEDGPGAGNTSAKPTPRVFAPSPFACFLNLEIQRCEAREKRWVLVFWSGSWRCWPKTPACPCRAEPAVSARSTACLSKDVQTPSLDICCFVTAGSGNLFFMGQFVVNE